MTFGRQFLFVHSSIIDIQVGSKYLSDYFSG